MWKTGPNFFISYLYLLEHAESARKVMLLPADRGEPFLQDHDLWPIYHTSFSTSSIPARSGTTVERKIQKCCDLDSSPSFSLPQCQYLLSQVPCLCYQRLTFMH